MTSTILTPAAALPVSLAEFKDHLHYGDATREDSDLTAKLSAAVGNIEDATGRILIDSTVALYLPAWPCRDYIELPYGQTSSITSLKYRDSEEAQTTVATTVYRLDRAYDLAKPTQVIDGRARLTLRYNQSWPTVTLDTGEPIEVIYQSGWKDADSVPWQLKAAVLLEAAHLYRNRESVTLGTAAIESKVLARGVDDLISRFRLWGF